MAQHDAGIGARAWLHWEWKAALITIIGGILIANGIAAYFLWPRASTGPGGQSQSAAEKVDAEAAAALCSAALTTAKAYGIIPDFGKLASPKLELTQVRGRYNCLASTEAAKYVIAADLVCRDLRDHRCVALYSVTQDDGTVLYQRQG